MKKHILLLTSSLLLHTMLMAQQFSEQPIPGLPALTNSKAEWSDLDNNGFVDLLVSGQTDIGADYFNVFLNIGDGSFTASSAGISTLANMQFGLADLNHDGFIDLFVSGEDGAGQANTTYYANDGDGSFTGSVTGLVQLKDGDFALKDFDQDGDIDLIYSGRDDSSNRQTVAYRNENGELINETISLPGLANGAIKAADFNGDGLADVLLSGIGNAANRVTEVYLNEGNWNFSASANSFIATAFNQIAVSDIDLNGSLDFVMTGISDSGFQSLYYSNENGVFSLSNIGLTAFASGQVGIADFNGDQYPDILIGGSTSGGLFENQYLRSDGLTGFDNRVSPLDQITNGSYAVADFNKDSYVDVYYSGSRETDLFEALLENDTTYVVSAPVVPVNLNAATWQDSVMLSWDVVSNAVSYNVYVKNLTTDSVIVMPGSNLIDGFNKSNQFGNSDVNTLPLYGLPEGNYEWRVQSIDANFRGSEFAVTSTFQLCNNFSIGADTAICFNESLTLNAGTAADVVRWFSKTNGLLQYGGNDFSIAVQQTDTIVAEVSKPFGCVVKDTIIVDVIDLPVFDIGRDTAICFNNMLTVTVPGFGSTEIDSVNWYSKVSGDQLIANSADFTYTVTAKDTLIAEVFNVNRCVNYDSIIVDVIDLPVFDIGFDTVVCFNEMLTVTVPGAGSTEIDSVNWYSKVSGDQLIANSADYTYTVTSKDTLIAEVFNASRCVNYDSIIVDVIDLPVFNVGADTAICFNEMLTVTVPGFGSAAIDSVNWYSKVSGNQLIANSAEYTYAVTAKDTLIAEVFNVNRCVNYDTIIVDVIDLPVFNIGVDTAICFNEMLTVAVPGFGSAEIDSVNWYSKVSGNQLIANSANYTYAVTAKDTLIAEVFNASRCVNFDTIIVDIIDLPVFNIGVDTAICFNEMLTVSVSDPVPGFGSDEIDSVNWYSKVSGDQLVANSADYTYLVTAKDTLIAEVFNVNRCVNYDSIIVDVIDLPDFNIGADTAICFNEMITISVSDPVPGFGTDEIDSVNWYSKVSGDQLVANSADYTYAVTAKDTLIAEVFNVSRCVNFDTIIVDVIDLPDFNVGADTAICFNEMITISVSGFGTDEIDSVNWYSKVSGNQLIANSAEYTYAVTAKDTLIAEVFNVNRCVNYDSIIVDVIDLPVFDIGPDTAVCFNELLTVSVPGAGSDEIDSVNWYSKVSGNQLIANSANYTYSVTSKDTLIAEVFNASRCVNFDSIIVDVIDLPVFDIGLDTAVCFNEMITLSVPNFGSDEIDSVNWYSKVSGVQLIANSADYSYSVTEKDTLIAEVFNISRCVNFDTIIVDVIDLPVFDLGDDRSLCVGEEILLQTSTSLDSTNWLLNDGTMLAANSFFYNHLVSQTDTIVAEFFNSSGCVNYDTIVINANPLPEFSLGQDMVSCSGDSIRLETPDHPTIEWYNDAAELIATGKLLNQAFTNSTEIIAVVTDGNGCVFTDTIQLTVNDLPRLSLPADTTLCFGSQLIIDAGNEFNEVTWTSENNGILERVRMLTYQVSQTDQIFLSVTDDNGCSFADTTVVNVSSLPILNVSGKDEICNGEAIELSVSGTLDSVSWFSANKGLIDSNDFVISQAPEISDQYMITGFTDFGCIDSTGISIKVNQLPIVDAGEDVLACKALELTLGSENNDPSLNYRWSPATFLDNQQAYRPIATPEQNIVYQLSATDANGCIGTDSVSIEVNPVNVIEAGGNTEICIGDAIQLGGLPTASGSNFGYRYQWSPAALFDDPSLANPVTSPQETTEFRLLVFTGECKVDTVFTTITVNELPEVSVIADTTIGGGEPIELFASGGVSYSWSPTLNLNDPTIANPLLTDLQTDVTYQVSVTDANGCKDQSQVRIFVKNQIFIPELFTPNDDGANDVFLIYGDGIQEIALRIYDTSGNLLYETDDPQTAQFSGWDGKSNGQTLPDGNYIWTIEGKYFNGSSVEFNGKNKGVIRLIK